MLSTYVRRTAIAGALAVCVSALGCADKDAHAKLDKLDRRVDKLEKSLDRLDDIALRLGTLTRGVDRLDELSAKIDRIDQATSRGLRPEAARAQLGRQRPLRPDPTQVYAVPIDGAPFRGTRDAPVTIVKSFEFACPFCRRVAPTMDALLKEYRGQVKVVYKHFIVHRSTATTPALAACAAHQQGKFSRMAKLIWERGFDDNRNLSRDNMLALARRAGLRMKRFVADMDGACGRIVKNDQAEMTRLGARGTPAFFINGRFLSGAQPIHRFRTVIDDELRKAKSRIAQGTRARDYYRTWVIDQGKKSL